MSKYSVLLIKLIFILLPFHLAAQEDEGVEENVSSGTILPITYTRQSSQNGNEFLTVYKINKNGKPIYSIELSNEIEMERIRISTLDIVVGNGSYSYITYNKDEMGLICVNKNFLSMVDEEIIDAFDLIISFQDTMHTYATINRISFGDGQYKYSLNPLSSFLIKKNNKIVSTIKDNSANADADQANQQRLVKLEQDRKTAWEDSISAALDSLAMINDDLRRKIDSSRVMNERLLDIQRQERYQRYYYPYDTFSSQYRNEIAIIVNKFIASDYLAQTDVKDFYFDIYLKVWIDTSGNVKRIETIGENSQNNSVTRNYNAYKRAVLAVKNKNLKLPITNVVIYDKLFPVISQTTIPFKVSYVVKSEKWLVSSSGNVTPPVGEPVNKEVYNEFVDKLSNPRPGKYILKVVYVVVNNETSTRILTID